MQRTRRFFVALALAANVVACRLILGIGDDEFRYVAPEPAEAAAPDAGAPTRCTVGHVPPEAPETPDTFERNRYVFAFRGVDVSGKTDAGTVVGYDLDGVCTCDSRDTSVNAGKQTCTPPRDAGEPCDDDGGVDNALAKGFAQFAGLAALTGVNLTDPAESACGKQTALLLLSDYNGEANDPVVSIGLIPSHGIREPHANEEFSDAGPCEDRAADGTPWPARFDGTDVWSHRREDINVQGALTRPLNGFVRDFQLVFDGRPSRVEQPVVLVALGGNIVTVGSPILTARLIPLDENGVELRVVDGNVLSTDGTPRKAASFRLADGVLTGRVSAGDVLSALASIRIENAASKYFCTHALFPEVKKFVCGAVDSLTTPNRDFAGDPCNALSLAFHFDAMTAKLGQEFDPTTAPDGGCAESKLDCREF
jgi:hypothetical protein